VLDVAVDELIVQRRRSRDPLGPVSALFRRGTTTALAGPAGAGKSTLLAAIAGVHDAASGSIRIGSRNVETLSPSRRPVLYSERHLLLPRFWSVRHVLISALRQRTLSREERLSELDSLTERWSLDSIIEQSVRTLSGGQAARLRLAQLEALRPGIALLERPFAGAAAGDRPGLIEQTFRMLRGIGATVVFECSDVDELAACDGMIVLEEGTIAQRGLPSEIYNRPATLAAAEATGMVNAIPALVSRGVLESAIGSWETSVRDGEVTVLARPEWFAPATASEESDFIFAIEDAGFTRGRWLARGILTGSVMLQVELPAGMSPSKGKLLPMRFDPQRFTLLPQALRRKEFLAALPTTGGIPPLAETR
jgi:ABC-type sugar transport system ATPase subunit